MLKKLKLLKKPLFQKRRWSCDFPPRKDGILYPRRVVLGLPSPSHRVCADGRTYGCTDVRTDVRTDGHVTIMKQSAGKHVLVGHECSLAPRLSLPFYSTWRQISPNDILVDPSWRRGRVKWGGLSSTCLIPGRKRSCRFLRHHFVG